MPVQCFTNSLSWEQVDLLGAFYSCEGLHEWNEYAFEVRVMDEREKWSMHFRLCGQSEQLKLKTPVNYIFLL